MTSRSGNRILGMGHHIRRWDPYLWFGFTILGVLQLLLLSPYCGAAHSWIVSSDGLGDFVLVSEACEVAASGDTILIQPGIYDEYDGPYEWIWVSEKTLALIGNGVEPADVSLRMSFAFHICHGTLLSNLVIREEHGSVYCNMGSMTIRSCRFEDNTGNAPGDSGGAIQTDNGTVLLVEDSIFIDNRVSGTGATGGAGGAIAASGAITVRRCRFIENVAIRGGGAIDTSGDGAVIQECIFYRNQADNGAAITLEHGAILTNCTFLANRVTGYQGACVEVRGSLYVPIEHCIVAGTVDGYGFGCWLPAEVNCCDLWDNDLGEYAGDCGVADGAGDFSEDPLFCDPETGDVGLLEGSPCLPGNHGGVECSLIGAKGLGCGDVPVLRVTWGEVKATYK